MFPMDWNEWRKEWNAWKEAHADHLTNIGAKRSAFPGKNFLANEVLGRWKVNGRPVELSEVTFPNLSERDAKTGALLNHDVRYIGITFDAAGPNGKAELVDSFAALESALGIGS